MARSADATLDRAGVPRPSAAEVVRDHGDFVWRSLSRLGIPEPDLLDTSQEVFVVVHRKLGGWNGEGKLTTWLFGICLRVAAAWRRRAHRRREIADDQLHDRLVDAEASPEANAARRQARALLDRVLASLSLEQRAVFVMYELDELSCHEIAETLGCPVGTVHSRLHHARKAFEAAARRHRIREGTP